MNEPRKPVPMTLNDLGKALRVWARGLSPEQKAQARNILLKGKV